MTTLEIYRDKNTEWRWRMKAGNGRTVADCSEGFKRLDGLRRNIRTVFNIGEMHINRDREEVQGCYQNINLRWA